KAFLPELQQNLPVPAEYKKETPGLESDLGAYDAVYYAGDCNSGAKTIAINLPNDEKIQLEKGTRRLQLKNAMRAKYENILLPIADRMIAADQRPKISFDAFFANVMFHEVAHGLGIKNTLDGRGTVKDALKETYSPFEEAKADVLGAYMVTRLLDKGELSGDAESHYTTFLASVFRSVRFGSASDHGKANMICFNFLREQGAITREKDGRYRLDPVKTRTALTALAEKILVLQGDGDYARAKKWLDEAARIPADLQSDLDGLKTAGIPVDIVFEQGKEILGLE
ncbi:MAG: Zn-dependent hydrolase, partial [Bacteroidia bacterium]|nr:Zn-dependent hydrolase [Bacteroidia bacterium]